MKNILSGQRIFRGLLIGFILFIWGYKIPDIYSSKEVLFCYTRDSYGNKALIKDNGAVYVDDIFVMEIPKNEWDTDKDVTVTVILEDENGNQKIKTMRLYEKKP